MSGVPLYFNRSTRATNLIAILIIICLPVGLFLYGWFFQDAAATLLLLGFGVFVSGTTLILIHKSRILRFDSAPILMLRPDGIDMPGHQLLSWQVIRDAIVFTYEGDKTIGLRLRKDLSSQQRTELEADFKSSFDWQVFGMPVTLPFSGVSLSGEELLAQLQAHGVNISVAEKEITFGHESELA